MPELNYELPARLEVRWHATVHFVGRLESRYHTTASLLRNTMMLHGQHGSQCTLDCLNPSATVVFIIVFSIVQPSQLAATAVINGLPNSTMSHGAWLLTPKAPKTSRWLGSARTGWGSPQCPARPFSWIWRRDLRTRIGQKWNWDGGKQMEGKREIKGTRFYIGTSFIPLAVLTMSEHYYLGETEEESDAAGCLHSLVDVRGHLIPARCTWTRDVQWCFVRVKYSCAAWAAWLATADLHINNQWLAAAVLTRLQDTGALVLGWNTLASRPIHEDELRRSDLLCHGLCVWNSLAVDLQSPDTDQIVVPRTTEIIVSHFMVLMCGTLFRLTCGPQIYLQASSETDWKPRENFMLNRRHYYYYYNPAIRSIGRETKFTVAFFIHYVWLQISQTGLYWSAWNFAWQFGHISDRSSPILGGIAPGMAELRASTGAYGRICLLLKHLLLLLLLLLFLLCQSVWWCWYLYR